MFNNSFNCGFIGNNNGYPAPGSIGLNRYDYNSHFGCMVPITSNGRFDYSNPIFDSHGRDLRTPLQRNCVRPYEPYSPIDPLPSYKKQKNENLLPSNSISNEIINTLISSNKLNNEYSLPSFKLNNDCLNPYSSYKINKY